MVRGVCVCLVCGGPDPTANRTQPYTCTTEVKAYNFRVDPYAPATVWCTLRATGTHTGAGLGAGR